MFVLFFKIAYCPIDTSLSFGQAKKLLNEIKPRHLVTSDCYMRPPSAFPQLSDMTVQYVRLFPLSYSIVQLSSIHMLASVKCRIHLPWHTNAIKYCVFRWSERSKRRLSTRVFDNTSLTSVAMLEACILIYLFSSVGVQTSARRNKTGSCCGSGELSARRPRQSSGS